LSAAGLKPPHSPADVLVAQRPVTRIVTNPGAVQAILRIPKKNAQPGLFSRETASRRA